MAVTPYTKASSASIAGLVTDGNALMVTEQSNLDEQNYELLRDGTRRRRRPIRQEQTKADNLGQILIDTPSSSYIWKTPAFADNYSLFVEEEGGIVKFFSLYHDTPGFMRAPIEGEELPDKIFLDLWGIRTADTPTESVASTYTEGNGNLYIFNPRTGTIKVELTDVYLGTLRFTPIGTWTRDYLGAAETKEIDYRTPRDPALAAAGQYFVDSPATILFNSPTEKIKITGDIGDDRAYNLSNTGWDAEGVFEFGLQSGKDYFTRDASTIYAAPGASITAWPEPTVLADQVSISDVTLYKRIDNPDVWPATSDKYLAGRQVDDRGSSIFSFPQLTQSKDNKAMPPMGSRITHSDVHPAGSLVGLPSDLTSTMVQDAFTPGDTIIGLNVTFNERQSHRGINTYTPPVRANYAAFVHSFTYEITYAGDTYVGGFSGTLTDGVVIDAVPPGDAKTISFYYENVNLVNYTVQGDYDAAATSISLHSSPEYFPHYVPDNGNGFDYSDAGQRPRAGAYFAGRLWQTADSHNRIYFSQALETNTGNNVARGINKESLCFSAADPTDGDDNSIVASDGGYINTADSGTHYGLAPLGDSLLLFTDRGVWAVRPGNGFFTPTNYTFSKVLSAEVLGTNAWVLAEDQIHVSTEEGIISLTMESTSFGNTSIVANRMLDKRLMNGYEDIIGDWPNPKGAYDSETRVVRWLFRPKSWAAVSPTLEQPLLSYSMHHNAWYKYVLGTQERVSDISVIPYSAKTLTYNKFRYKIEYDPFGINLINTDWGIEEEYGADGLGTWSDTQPTDSLEKFADYLKPYASVESRDPVPAFMLTNHHSPGEGIRWSQINYIIVMNRNVTSTWIESGGTVSPNMEGGTLLSVRWDWMDQSTTGKFSTPYQTYKYRRYYMPQDTTSPNTYGEPVLVHKMKLRGRGREFRLYFESDGHKDSHIEGWAYQGYILNGV